MTQISRFLSRRETVDELLKRASDNLSKIGACFSSHLDDLPAEIRRERQCFDKDKELLALLDRHLRYDTLDNFLQKHRECVEMLEFVFGGKYPRLIQDPDLRRALKAADDTSSNDAQKFLASKRPRHRHQTSNGSTWTPKRLRGEDGTAVPLTQHERRALQAFDDFQTADDDPLMPPSARGRFLARAEFDALERRLNGLDDKESRVLVGTYLTFTLPPASPPPSLTSLSKQKATDVDLSPVSDAVQFTPTSEPFQKTPLSAIGASATIEKAVNEGRFTEYKGYLLEPPPSLLSKLKTYLSTPNVEQNANWTRFSADIRDYLAYLLQIRAGESWEAQLDEVVDMYRAHTLYDDFHRKHPGLDHSLWPDAMKPKTMLHNPFAPPGQQDISQSVVLGKKRKADDDTPSPLEDDDEFYDKDPIAFDNMILAEAPSEEAKDPYLYTRWHNRLKANVEQAANEARDATMERIKELKTKQDGFSVMDVPQNWNGPVSTTMLLDSEAGKTSSDWTRLRLLRTSLRRTARRSPRLLLEEVSKYIGLGMMFKQPDDERSLAESSAKAKGSGFVRLQQQEINWLSFLCQASLNDTSAALALEEAHSGDWKLGVLRKRIRQMQRSLEPGSFGDGQRITVRKFLELVNQDCDGPVKGHRFSMAELVGQLPPLVQLKALCIEQVEGAQYIRCFPGDVHPEEAIRWEDRPGPRRRTRGRQASDNEATPPADVGVPEIMPSMDHLRTVEECLVEQKEIASDSERTLFFFRRIAYRMGRTLQEVEAEGTYQRWLASDEKCQDANLASLRTLLTHWTTETAKVVMPQCRNGRIIASYTDVVLAADPDALARRNTDSDAETEAYCREIVRKNILREVAEDKTMLWPLSVPRDSSSVGARATKDGRTVLRRVAVWSFAHPSRRAPARKFFDVNTWPLEAQSEETQASIRAGRLGFDAMDID